MEEEEEISLGEEAVVDLQALHIAHFHPQHPLGHSLHLHHQHMRIHLEQDLCQAWLA